MRRNSIPMAGWVRKPMAGALLLVLILAGCATPGTVNPAQPEFAKVDAIIKTVKPGDSVDIHYLCRLKTGEVAAATEAVADAERKSNIWVASQETGPLSLKAVRPDEPAPERLEAMPFDGEIREQLMRKVTGMREGETRQMELTELMVQPREEQGGIARLSRVRTRPKEMRMDRTEYEFRAGKGAEVGQAFAVDPAIPGRVESVTDSEVALRFSAQPGAVVETPFGSGRIREEGENYKIDIDAREGTLVRTGKRIGRITHVSDQVITIDYRHPFGYEALTCDVTVRKIAETDAPLEGAKEK